MSRRAAIILAVILVALMAAMGVGALFLVRGARKSQDHLIPDGYVGWVTAKYGVDGAPALPVEEGRRVFRYDEQGMLETSSEFEEGWSWDSHFYADGDTLRPLRQMPPGFDGQIWGAHTMSQRVTRTGGKTIREGASTGFFVGTEEQFNAVRQLWHEEHLRDHGLILPPPVPPPPAPADQSEPDTD